MSKLTTEELIGYLLDPNKRLTFTSEKGTITIDLQAEFKFGFFADCINETILMGPINIIPSGDIQSYKQDGENLVNEHMVSK
ncbi:hypothetical protein FACS1894176_00680 [Bacteroidia bacterium]|nr:hypothetical protein FACS1894176_00680 [Bacteroidia bacterium]